MSTLTPAQIADDLGIAESTVLTYLREGRLPGFKIARRWVCDRDTYDSWKAAMSQVDPHGFTPRSNRAIAARRARK